MQDWIGGPHVWGLGRCFSESTLFETSIVVLLLRMLPRCSRHSCRTDVRELYKRPTGSGGDKRGLGAKTFSASTVKQTGQESGCQRIPQFRMLIVSAAKICKQCLQTASASADFRTKNP